MENEVWLIDMHTLWQCETCFHHYPNGCDTYCDHGESYRPAADKLTVIDPESLRPKGRWEYYSTTMQECSACKRHTARHKYDYCPRCGADMREGGE